MAFPVRWRRAFAARPCRAAVARPALRSKQLYVRLGPARASASDANVSEEDDSDSDAHEESLYDPAEGEIQDPFETQEAGIAAELRSKRGEKYEFDSDEEYDSEDSFDEGGLSDLDDDLLDDRSKNRALREERRQAASAGSDEVDDIGAEEEEDEEESNVGEDGWEDRVIQVLLCT
jgi:hypothetical protein